MTAIRRKVRSSSLPFRNARRTSIAPTAEKSLPKRRRKLPVLPLFHQEQFMQIRAQISDKSATQIDDQITDLSNCAFQVIPKEQKKQHVVDQMLDAKVKKHTRKQAIVFSALNQRRIRRTAVHHMSGALCPSGQCDCNEYQNIAYNDDQIDAVFDLFHIRSTISSFGS